MGFSVFGRMRDLKATEGDLLEGCEPVKRTGRMGTAHVLIQGCDALPLDQAARSRYCTCTYTFCGSREAVLAICSARLIIRCWDIVDVKLGYRSLQICRLPNNGGSNAPIFDDGRGDCDISVNGVWSRAGQKRYVCVVVMNTASGMV